MLSKFYIVILINLFSIYLLCSGAFRDLFGNYSVCVIFINIVTFTTLLMWTSELIYMKRKNSKINKEKEQNQLPELCKFNIEVN